jgi:hypothetical protein
MKILSLNRAVESGRHKGSLLNEESPVNQKFLRIPSSINDSKSQNVRTVLCQEENRESTQEKTTVKKDPHPFKGNRIDYSG